MTKTNLKVNDVFLNNLLGKCLDLEHEYLDMADFLSPYLNKKTNIKLIKMIGKYQDAKYYGESEDKLREKIENIMYKIISTKPITKLKQEIMDMEFRKNEYWSAYYVLTGENKK